MTLSQHARVRMNSRGIRVPAAVLAFDHGRRIRAREAVFIVLGRKEIARALRNGIDLSGHEGITLVCTTGGMVITAYRNRDFSKLKEHRRRRSSRRRRC